MDAHAVYRRMRDITRYSITNIVCESVCVLAGKPFASRTALGTAPCRKDASEICFHDHQGSEALFARCNSVVAAVAAGSARCCLYDQHQESRDSAADGTVD